MGHNEQSNLFCSVGLIPRPSSKAISKEGLFCVSRPSLDIAFSFDVNILIIWSYHKRATNKQSYCCVGCLLHHCKEKNSIHCWPYTQAHPFQSGSILCRQTLNLQPRHHVRLWLPFGNRYLDVMQTLRTGWKSAGTGFWSYPALRCTVGAIKNWTNKNGMSDILWQQWVNL